MRSLFLVLPLLATLGAVRAEAADLKIGYVDMAKALNDVEDGKAAKAKLKTDFDEKQKTLDALQNDLKAKKDEFDKKASMMKPEVKQEKQEDLQRRFLELQQKYMQMQKELMDRESQLTQEIAGRLRTVIARVGDRDSYNMVLDIGDTVLYFKRDLEITNEVVREYNRQYAGGAAGSASKK
jgi:outer membrane protein